MSVGAAPDAGADPRSEDLDDALPHGIPGDILQEALEEGASAADPPTMPDPERLGPG